MSKNIKKQQENKYKKNKRKKERLERIKNIAFEVIIIGIVVLALLLLFKSKVKIRTKPIGDQKTIEGREHISTTQKNKKYKTNPPTSGAHYGTAQPGGFYNRSIQDENAVHSLEHGYIWITFKDQSKNVLDELKKIAKRYPYRVVISYRKENDSPLALASWGRLLKLNNFDKKKIMEFIENNYNRSPEKLAK